MQLLLFAFSLVISVQYSHLTSIIDPNNVELGFIKSTIELISFVRMDIEQLENEIGNFDATKMLANQLKVLQHFKNVSKQVNQIEKQHVTQKGMYSVIYRENEALHIGKEFSMVSRNFEYMELKDFEQDETLLRLTAAISRLRKNSFGLNYISDIYLILYGVQCNHGDEQCKEIRSNLNRWPKIDSLYGTTCWNLQSPQYMFYSFYKEITLTELMAYILIEYSMMIQKASGNDNFIIEKNTVRENYNEITKNGINSLKKVLDNTNRHLWRCDPTENIPNVTYDVVTRLLQGYIENEVNLNNGGSCFQTCEHYQSTTSKGCFDEEFCTEQPKCSGRIHDCQFVDSVLSVYQSPENSTRRYEYIEYGESKSLGTFSNYWSKLNKVESWNTWIFFECSYCFCLCDEQSPKSDRYFNLRETLSDVNANKVVTGVRFVKRNRIFHLQIQQGELLPRGLINESTVEWKQVDNYEIGDSNAKEGVDYHTLTYQNRAIDLDEVTKPDDTTFVVTGVRFQVLDGHINLKVHFSKLDFLMGELVNPEVSNWQTKEHVSKRRQMTLDNLPLPPTSGVFTSSPEWTDYLEFTNTGMLADVAQSTIPYIDIQDVASIPPVALAGIGIYYKHRGLNGGFVAPQIISYDLSPHLSLIPN